MTFSHAQLTSISAATALSNIPAGCTGVLLQAETQNVRFTVDGTTPTSANGMLLLTTMKPYVWTGNVANLKFLQVASGAILNVTFLTERVSA